MLEPKIPRKMHNVSQIFIRSLIVTMVVGEAVLVPNLEPIITLMGSICFSTLGILIPAVIHGLLVCNDEVDWKGKLILCKDVFLVFFSLFILASGSYLSIRSMKS